MVQGGKNQTRINVNCVCLFFFFLREAHPIFVAIWLFLCVLSRRKERTRKKLKRSEFRNVLILFLPLFPSSPLLFKGRSLQAPRGDKTNGAWKMWQTLESLTIIVPLVYIALSSFPFLSFFSDRHRSHLKGPSDPRLVVKITRKTLMVLMMLEFIVFFSFLPFSFFFRERCPLASKDEHRLYSGFLNYRG